MQWLRFDLATVHSHLEAAAVYARHMTWLADQNDPGFLRATLRAKLLANQIAVDAAQLALKAGGGSGYLSTSPIQRILRDAYAGWVMAYSSRCAATGSALTVRRLRRKVGDARPRVPYRSLVVLVDHRVALAREIIQRFTGLSPRTRSPAPPPVTARTARCPAPRPWRPARRP